MQYGREEQIMTAEGSVCEFIFYKKKLPQTRSLSVCTNQFFIAYCQTMLNIFILLFSTLNYDELNK